MPIYYLETSALLKRYRTEQGTDTINDLFKNRRPDEVLVTSYFTTLEVEAVAARAHKGRVLSRAAYRALLGRFADDLGESIVVQPVFNAVITESIDLARRYALRAADTIHLATSLHVSQAALSKTIFVASDKELLNAARGEGFESLDPQHSDAGALLKQLRKEED